MASYDDLIKQREVLDQQIKEARQRELQGAITQVRDLIAKHGLSEKDVFPSGRGRRAGTVGKVAPKYRDPATGNTWTGRGKPPLWIAGKDRTKYLIG